MKIALHIPDFGGGGAERVVANLANEFAVRGHAVDLVIGNARGAVYLNELLRAVNVIDLKVTRMRNGLPGLTRYLRDSKPDVLMPTRVHSCCMSVIAARLARSRTAIVLREANTISMDLKQHRWLKRLVLAGSITVLYPMSNAIIGVSKGVVDDLTKWVPRARQRLHLVYSPIITDGIAKTASELVDHPWFRNRAVPIVLSAGRLTQQKRFDLLIRAFSMARQKVAARLVILGEGELKESLQELIVTLGRQEDIAILGFDPNPFKFMARSALFVSASAWEGLPGSLIQAIACGCPVVSTDCPSGPREILQNGRLGRLVPVGDAEALASAIEHSLVEPSVQIANQADLRPYTVGASAENYLRVFELARAS